jgi:hypothetical protein
MRTTGTRNVVATMLAGGLLAVASPAIAHAQSPQSDEVPAPVARILAVGDGKYGVQNYKSGKFLQPTGSSTANGARIVQQPQALTGSGDYVAAQNWNVFNSGGSYTSFENSLSGKNLGINGASTASGAAAIQANPAGDANQDWQFTESSYPNGWYAVKNRKSGLCLGISGASTANGAQAAQFPCDGSANQGWRIIDR